MTIRKSITILSICSIILAQNYGLFTLAFEPITSSNAQVVTINQCTDGIDNDGDGTRDALVTGANSVQSFPLNDVNGVLQLNDIYPNIRTLANTVGANYCDPLPEQVTLDKVCQQSGYDFAVSWGSRSYSSPHNNCVFRINPATNTAEAIPATSNNNHAEPITCGRRSAACNDGIDNDRDGQIDMGDSGCFSPDDSSETQHDTGCSGTGDITEGDTQCSDGQDNDGDGKVDAQVTLSASEIQALNYDLTPQMITVIDGINQTYGTIGALARTVGASRCEAVPEQATLNSVCQQAGYISAVPNSWTSRPYSSPHNNCVFRLSNGNPEPIPATAYNNHTESLRCYTAVIGCSDGVDNDGDGLVDLGDSGCTSTGDTSELTADPTCTSLSGPTETDPIFQCSDGIDNDGDGAIDSQDFSCANTTDNDETNPKAQCQDGLDNDGDGKIDTLDPRCHTDNNASNAASYNPQDNDEFPVDVTVTQCNDGVDNDGDGATDLADFSCSGPTDTDETNPKAQCQDGIDNDADGKTDTQDPRCHTDNNASNAASYNPQDNDEFPVDVTVTQCNDGVDNDFDGLIDLADAGCTGPTDNDETNPTGSTQCSDGQDNDSDGVIDAQDPGCWSIIDQPSSYNPLDTDESDGTPACRDGLDNDGDGKIDFGTGVNNDTGCSSPTDNDESSNMCTNGINYTLGTSFDTPRTGDSLSTVTRPIEADLRCPAGMAVTQIAYKDLVSTDPFIADAVDGLTIACAPINANGTIGSQTALQSNGDIDGNSNSTILVQCPAGSVAGTAMYKGEDFTGTISDTTDGVTLGCRQITSGGLSPTLTPAIPSDIANNSRPFAHVSCPSNSVVSGIVYANFGDTRPEFFDLVDAIAYVHCTPLNFSCNAVTTQCNDGVDNDGDGATDLADFSCSGPTDTDETNPKAQCQDGLDNDADGKTDTFDPRCHTDNNASNAASYNPQDNDEFPVDVTVTQCNDGVDNDGDGATDLADFSCSGPTDTDETNPKAQCQDGIDNDADGKTDFGTGANNDAGCASLQDNDEANTIMTQCNDGVDNDGDGALDLNDFSCGNNPANNNETTPQAQCQDGVDNDGDGKIDFGTATTNDSGCTSRQDNDELPITTQCNDGIDNDADGAIDFSNDFSCTSALDNDETNLKAQCQDGIDNDADGKIDGTDPRCHTDNNASNAASYNPQDNDESPADLPTITDLTIAKSGPTTVNRGGTLSYTLTVTNGAAPITNVKVSDTFPSPLQFTTATGGATCSTISTNQVDCTIASMAINAVQTITLNFTVPSITTGCTQQVISNTATVRETDATITESNATNNTSNAVSTTLTCSTGSVNDITITKTDGRTSAYAGDNTRYLITMSNTSTNTLSNLQITDTVPSGLTILSVSDGGQISGQTITWNSVNFDANQSKTFTIDTQISSTVSNNTTLTNTASIRSSDGNSKSASDSTLVYANTTVTPTYPTYPPYPTPTYPTYPTPTYPSYPTTPSYPQYPTYPQAPIYPQQPIVYPITGGENADLYGTITNTSELTQVEAAKQESSSGMIYATMLAILSLGSAAASKLFAGRLFI
jgi:uncharacterized repeat protein (TIGR01451 family)